MSDLHGARAALRHARGRLETLETSRTSTTQHLARIRNREHAKAKNQAVSPDPETVDRLEGQIDDLTAKITAQELEVARLESEALAAVLTLETAAAIPEMVATLTRLWAIHLRVEYPARTLGSFAARLLAEPLREATAAARDDPGILETPLDDIRKKHELGG